MTQAQWLWEFEALAHKETEEVERQLELFRLAKKQIISLLGLSLLSDDTTLKDNPDAFVPWALLGARREVAQSILTKIDKKEAEAKVEEDPEFERLSAAIASGEIGDMDPIISIDEEALKKARKQVEQEDLKMAGVRLVDKPRQVGHISFDKEEVAKRARSGLEDIVEARKQVEQEIEQRGNLAQGQGMSVLFDEDD